jgi:hypothetical protein
MHTTTLAILDEPYYECTVRRAWLLGMLCIAGDLQGLVIPNVLERGPSWR